MGSMGVVKGFYCHKYLFTVGAVTIGAKKSISQMVLLVGLMNAFQKLHLMMAMTRNIRSITRGNG